MLCALIPAALCYLMYLLRGIHPFGDGSVLVLDLNGQYVWFFEALRNFAKGDASLLYSFARAMGGEFMGMYAYYLSSPLSFIVCLFPIDRMLEGLLLLFLIKTALCGLTFGYYMHKTSSDRRPYAIVIFSICYALCSYGIVQQHNTMWIDAMMWLPLITLGIESLIKHGKFKLYTIFLAITLFSNFYIGYMICIYCFFYFFIYYIGHGKDDENNPFGERFHFFKSLLRMAFYSVLAVGIASVILLCAYYSLNFGKSTFSDPSWNWEFTLNTAWDLLYKFLPGSYDTVRPEGYPFVYCSILTLLLLPAYFLSKKFSIRQKICSAIFIAIFLASFSVSVLDLLWHGFQRPNWLNYRYSFMICFYLCVLACRALIAFESYRLRIVVGAGVILTAVCLYLERYNDGAFVQPDKLTCIWFSIIVILLYLCVLGLIQTYKSKTAVCILLAVVVCAEVVVNGLCNMNSLHNDVVYTSYSTYNDYLDDVRPIVDLVQESDDSFYRMEKTMFRKINDNMALKMRGLSGSTSTLNQETVKFLQKMGYASESHWSKYLGGTPVSDSLLGIKYVITDQYFNELDQYYDPYTSTGKYQAYINPYALSIAYGVSDNLLDFNLGYIPQAEEAASTAKPENTEPNADEIGDAISKGKAWLNQLLGIDETVRRAEYADDYHSPFERLNAIITAMLGETETVQVFVPVQDVSVTTKGLDDPYYGENHICYTFEEGDGVGRSLTYSFDMPADAELYYYMPTNYPREVSLTLYDMSAKEGRNYGRFGGHETFRIISLGVQQEGTKLSLRATAKGNGLYYFFEEPSLYYIDKAVFEDAMARLAQDQLIVTDYTEDSFQGTFTASREKELVMTTLAYDQGWRITVDGKKVEPVKALGSVLAFYIEGDAGETHDVSLVYRPNVLVVGGIISGVSLATFLALVSFDPLMKKAPFLRSVVSVPAGDEQKKKSLRRKKA